MRTQLAQRIAAMDGVIEHSRNIYKLPQPLLVEHVDSEGGGQALVEELQSLGLVLRQQLGNGTECPLHDLVRGPRIVVKAAKRGLERRRGFRALMPLQVPQTIERSCFGRLERAQSLYVLAST